VPLVHIVTNRFPANPDDEASPFVRDFAAALAGRGVTVEVSTPGYAHERVEPPGIKINWLPWTGRKEVIGESSLSNPSDLLALWRFWRAGGAIVLQALQSRRADHCLALWALPSGWFALRAKKRLGIPYSVWCLGSDIYLWAKRPFIRGIIKKVLAEADHVFADAQDLCRAASEVSGKDCLFLPSLRILPEPEAQTSVPEPPSRAAAAGAQAPHVPFHFLYVGRLEKAKGVFLALEAFAKAQLSNPQSTITFLGWGPDESSLKAEVTRLGLDEAVRFCGKGGPTEVARFMRACDCLVIPSFRDSIPLVFGEALQAKIPLIVTDVGDMGSLTREHALGLVVRPGDADGLAAAMGVMASGGPQPGYHDRMQTLLARFHPAAAASDFLSAAFGKVE
jgi:glycosyltransferase involved in cell wall biosynthesis